MTLEELEELRKPKPPENNFAALFVASGLGACLMLCVWMFSDIHWRVEREIPAGAKPREIPAGAKPPDGAPSTISPREIDAPEIISPRYPDAPEILQPRPGGRVFRPDGSSYPIDPNSNKE